MKTRTFSTINAIVTIAGPRPDPWSSSPIGNIAPSGRRPQQYRYQRKYLLLQLDSQHMPFCLPDIANCVNDRIAPRERTGGPAIQLRRFAVDGDFDVPVGEVDAQAVRMPMARLDRSGRDMHVEDSHERVLERNLVRVRRDLHRIQRIVLRARRPRQNEDNKRRDGEKGESFPSHEYTPSRDRN